MDASFFFRQEKSFRADLECFTGRLREGMSNIDYRPKYWIPRDLLNASVLSVCQERSRGWSHYSVHVLVLLDSSCTNNSFSAWGTRVSWTIIFHSITVRPKNSVSSGTHLSCSACGLVTWLRTSRTLIHSGSYTREWTPLFPSPKLLWKATQGWQSERVDPA